MLRADTEFITEYISVLKASENPLSADVGIIEGKQCIYLYDVGNSEVSWHLLQTLGNSDRKLKAVLSHFHPDHIGNLKRIDNGRCPAGENEIGDLCQNNVEYKAAGQVQLAEIYLGANTRGYTQSGYIIRQDSYIDDGVRLHIFPLPSSHAKGCLGLEVNGAYAFLGDAVYSTKRDGKIVYNATLLEAQMRVLEKLEANFFLLSHQERFVQEKDEVLKRLHKIYEKRVKGEPYIVLYE